MVALFYIDCIFSELGLSNEEKINWIKNFDNAFRIEADKNLNNQLKRKYIDFQPKYFEFIKSNKFKDIRNLIINNISDILIVMEKILELEKKECLNVGMKIFSKYFSYAHQ